MKKIPLRSCVITHEKYEKKDLLRVVRTPEGNVIFDEIGRANGKGAYLKKDKEVILKAQKNKMLDKVLEKEVPEEVYKLLLEKVDNN